MGGRPPEQEGARLVRRLEADERGDVSMPEVRAFGCGRGDVTEDCGEGCDRGCD